MSGKPRFFTNDPAKILRIIMRGIFAIRHWLCPPEFHSGGQLAFWGPVLVAVMIRLIGAVYRNPDIRGLFRGEPGQLCTQAG